MTLRAWGWFGGRSQKRQQRTHSVFGVVTMPSDILLFLNAICIVTIAMPIGKHTGRETIHQINYL